MFSTLLSFHFVSLLNEVSPCATIDILYIHVELFTNVFLCFCSLECEKLIRRMLQLEPAKRIPLGKVLEHRWMQGMAPDLQPTNSMRVFGSNDNILWNTPVLAAIQKMNYDVERCKQVCKYMYIHLYGILLNCLHNYHP